MTLGWQGCDSIYPSICAKFSLDLNVLFPCMLCMYIIQDIELSKEINESFRQSSQARTKLPSGIELSVHVLTSGYFTIFVIYLFIY